jgi:serralysin
MVTTFPSFHFEYGFVQVVAKNRAWPGLWPALWLAAADLAYPPEMDIIESWGTKQLTGSYFHPVGADQVRAVVPVDWTTGWQTYTLTWSKTKMAYYVGGHVVLTVTKRVPHQPMYFIADLAEYLKPVKGYCDGQMQIRWVKVWKL